MHDSIPFVIKSFKPIRALNHSTLSTPQETHQLLMPLYQTRFFLCNKLHRIDDLMARLCF